MKKIALLMALLMLVVSFAACGGQTKDPQATNGTGTGGEETAEAAQGECEHQLVEELIDEATCTQKGLVQHTCNICNEILTEEIPATGHDGSGASCTEASTCANCGEVVEDAWGHKDENGVCANCGIDITDGSAETEQETEAAEATEEA